MWLVIVSVPGSRTGGWTVGVVLESGIEGEDRRVLEQPGVERVVSVGIKVGPQREQHLRARRAQQLAELLDPGQAAHQGGCYRGRTQRRDRPVHVGHAPAQHLPQPDERLHGLELVVAEDRGAGRADVLQAGQPAAGQIAVTVGGVDDDHVAELRVAGPPLLQLRDGDPGDLQHVRDALRGTGEVGVGQADQAGVGQRELGQEIRVRAGRVAGVGEPGGEQRAEVGDGDAGVLLEDRYLPDVGLPRHRGHTGAGQAGRGVAEELVQRGHGGRRAGNGLPGQQLVQVRVQAQELGVDRLLIASGRDLEGPEQLVAAGGEMAEVGPRHRDGLVVRQAEREALLSQDGIGVGAGLPGERPLRVGVEFVGGHVAGVVRGGGHRGEVAVDVAFEYLVDQVDIGQLGVGVLTGQLDIGQIGRRPPRVVPLPDCEPISTSSGVLPAAFLVELRRNCSRLTRYAAGLVTERQSSHWHRSKCRTARRSRGTA